MPVITQGNSASIPMNAADSVAVQAGSGYARFECPIGTVVAEFSGARTFGPYDGASTRVTALQGSVYYEYVDGTRSTRVTGDEGGNVRPGQGAILSLANAGLQNTVALLGDSITLNNLPVPSLGQYFYASAGHFTVANAMMGWQYEIAGVFGYSGQASDYILAQLQASVLSLSPRPRFCAVLAGTNDGPSGLTSAQTIANLKAIYSGLMAAGITPWVATLPPRNDAGTTLARKRRDTRVNRWIREWARVNDVVCFDFYRVLVNPTSTGTAGWALASDNVGAISDTTVDQIHPNNCGAFYMGAELKRKLTGRLNQQTRSGSPQVTDCMYTAAGGAQVEGNIIPNGSFSGTAGNKGAVATGQLADEWSRQGDSAPAGGGTIVLSKVARTDQPGWWQQIAISGGSAGDNQGSFAIRTDQDYPSANGQLGPSTWQVGDSVWGQVAFETDAAGWANGGDTNCNIAIRIQFLNATGAVTDTGWGQNAGGSSKHRMPDGVLRTPTYPVPPGTTAIYFWIYVAGRGAWRFGDAEVRKVIAT